MVNWTPETISILYRQWAPRIFNHFRRLVVCYERKVLVFLGLVHMACALIALRRILG